MLDGNEIEVNKRLSTTGNSLTHSFADNAFFRSKSDFERNKKKHGWRLFLHSITTESCPNKCGITARDFTKLCLHIFLDIIVFNMERTNWPRFRNAVITAVRPPDFIQLPASKQALRGRRAGRRSRWKPSLYNPTSEGLLAGYLVTVDSLLTVTLVSIWHYGKMPKIILRNIVEFHLQWVLRSAYKVKCQQSGVHLTIPAATHWHALPWLRTRGKSNILSKILKLSYDKTGNKKTVQLVLQHCWKTIWIAMLRVLSPTFKPVLQQIRWLQVASVLTSNWIKRTSSEGGR